MGMALAWPMRRGEAGLMRAFDIRTVELRRADLAPSCGTGSTRGAHTAQAEAAKAGHTAEIINGSCPVRIPARLACAYIGSAAIPGRTLGRHDQLSGALELLELSPFSLLQASSSSGSSWEEEKPAQSVVCRWNCDSRVTDAEVTLQCRGSSEIADLLFRVES